MFAIYLLIALIGAFLASSVRVLREYFGYPKDVATRLMLAVHHEGHAVVSEGPREQMELHAQAMHDYGLWATIRKAPE